VCDHNKNKVLNRKGYMGSLVSLLQSKQLINCPYGIDKSVQYEVIMGSTAYGVSSNTSDIDIYGFALPPRALIFPHEAGEIQGFGTQLPRFQNFQRHHIKDQDTGYDIDIYNIVRYFDLCMGCNPNMIDSLFVPERCVLHMTPVGQRVREKRKLFLSKKAWHTFKGYAYAQLHKIKTKLSEGSRAELVKKYGYDVKFGYHVVRLLNEVEQILSEHDIDLERNREQLKAIRRGEWALAYLENWFAEKEKALEDVYLKSTLQHKPDETKIKDLLLECLEMHYGSLPIKREEATIKAELLKIYAAIGNLLNV
jgi:predicted nucleotidyltransferase